MESNVKNADSFDIFIKNGIPYGWETVYVGYLLKILSSKEISLYATEYLLQSPTCTNQYIVELAYNAQENKIEQYLKKILTGLYYSPIEKGSARWEIEKKKWRYFRLQSMLCVTKDIYQIIEAIESIYCEFDYPEDMNSFISYNPESGFRTISKNVIIVNIPSDYLDNLKKYLDDEKQKLLLDK